MCISVVNLLKFPLKSLHCKYEDYKIKEWKKKLFKRKIDFFHFNSFVERKIAELSFCLYNGNTFFLNWIRCRLKEDVKLLFVKRYVNFQQVGKCWFDVEF